MKNTDVVILVIPDEPAVEYDPLKDGKAISTKEQIRVNKVGDHYTVIYTETGYKELILVSMIGSLVNAFNQNVPNTHIRITIEYRFTEDSFNESMGHYILSDGGQLAEMAYKYNFEYVENTQNRKLIQRMLDYDYPSAFDEDEFDDEDDDDEYDPLRELGFYDDDYHRPEYHDRPKYRKSEVYRNAANPKRDIKRHGVIIADDKDDLKRDEKAIKSFLKDFIPGDAEWKKDFRKELTKRWVAVYSVTKKQLKRLERSSRRNKKSKKSAKKCADFTRRLLTPTDRWNDITR